MRRGEIETAWDKERGGIRKEIIIKGRKERKRGKS